MKHAYSVLLIRDNPNGPGLEVRGSLGQLRSVRIGTCATLTLWELRGKLKRVFPGADVYFDPQLALDPDYTGREVA